MAPLLAAVLLAAAGVGSEQLHAPVFDFWNADNQEHTFHMGEPWPGEVKSNLQYYAFTQPVPGAKPVYAFWHAEHREHTIHMGRPWEGEEQRDIVFYALQEQTPCTQPVSDFWHHDHREHTFHMGEPWAGEMQGSIQFYAYPNEHLADHFDCDSAHACDFMAAGQSYVKGVDWSYEEVATAATVENCKAKCVQTPQCTGIDVRNDGQHCTFWFSGNCDVAHRAQNPGWVPVKHWTTCTRRCSSHATTSTLMAPPQSTLAPVTPSPLTTAATPPPVPETTGLPAVVGESPDQGPNLDARCQAGYFAVYKDLCRQCQPGQVRRRRAASCGPCPPGTMDAGDYDDCQPEPTTTTLHDAGPAVCSRAICPEGWTAAFKPGHKCYGAKCGFTECCKPTTTTDTTTTITTTTTNTNTRSSTTKTTSTTLTFTSTTFTTSTDEHCGPGYFSLDGHECLRCESGATRRRNSRGPEWCSPCPEGTYHMDNFDDCISKEGTTTTQPNPCNDFKWEPIARQNLSASRDAYFSHKATETFLENPDDPDAPTWMVIGRIKNYDDEYYSNGVYRFQLMYDGHTTLEWRQNSWLANPKIRGFACIHPLDCGPASAVDGIRFTGLGKSSADTWSVLDGEGEGHWQWFNSVGTVRKYSGGIPGWNHQTQRTMQLSIARCVSESDASPGHDRYRRT